MKTILGEERSQRDFFENEPSPGRSFDPAPHQPWALGTCRAANTIISSSVQSISSVSKSQRACSYSWVSRTGSVWRSRGIGGSASQLAPVLDSHAQPGEQQSPSLPC